MPQSPPAIHARDPDASSPGSRVVTKAYLAAQLGAVQSFSPQVADMILVPDTPGTSSLTYVMEGLNVQIVATSTKALVIISGNVSQSQNGRETDVVMCYGTGAPPLVGDPQTGTILTQPARFLSTAGGGTFAPFTLPAVINDLTIGESYWFGLAIKVTGGSGNVTEVNVVAHSIA